MTEHGAHPTSATAPAGEPRPGATHHLGHQHEGHSGRGTGVSHGKHAGHHVEAFRRRFWWSLLLTIPLVVTSEMVREDVAPRLT